MGQKKIVIIGAGPTGLGAGYRLNELGYQNWALYEKTDHIGGHATTHVDDKGFLWDEGVHVIFSHYPYFDRMIDQALGEEVHQRVRESWIVSGQTWVPYPFQNNLRYLPKELQLKCLVGAAKVTASRNGDASNFRDWILATFGEGIAEAFMFPYNQKVWTTPLERMSKTWIAERVPFLDFKRLLENVLYERDDVAWGPNSKFKFPLHGGTGQIYRRIASHFTDKIQHGKKLVEVNPVKRTVSFSDGSGDSYDFLVSTIPLDLLVQMFKPAQPELTDATALLEHNNLLVLGLGIEKNLETSKSWVYFTDTDLPFYRATYFSHYSPFNVPGGDNQRYCSMMCEASIPNGQTVDAEHMLDQAMAGMIRAGILEEADRQRVISRYTRFVPYSYPIPTLERDKGLGIIQPALLDQGIYSRGRFGAWRYEIGNMDHSVMMGVEAVGHVLSGEKENVFHSS